MDYSQSRYCLYIFYSKSKVEQFKEVYLGIELRLWQVLKKVSTKYYSHGLLYKNGLKIDKLKKDVYNPELKKGVRLFLDRISEEIKEAGYYIVDKDYTKEVPPIFLLNLHISPKANFGRKVLYYEKETEKVHSYVCMAIDNILFKDVSDEFERIAAELFKNLNGVMGYKYINVPYTYDGISNIEWAFKNIPAQLENGNIANWHSTEGKRMDSR
jgi:hypothetical protein